MEKSGSYHLYSERLAGALLDEWIEEAIQDRVEGFEQPDYFNLCYLAETDEKIAGLPVQRLYARWGNRVIRITMQEAKGWKRS